MAVVCQFWQPDDEEAVEQTPALRPLPVPDGPTAPSSPGELLPKDEEAAAAAAAAAAAGERTSLRTPPPGGVEQSALGAKAQVEAQLEAAQHNKVCCGMTAVALAMLLKGRALGLLDFWTDVSVTLAWRASGDEGWFNAGWLILLIGGGQSGYLLWIFVAGRLAGDSKPRRWAKLAAALPLCLALGLVGLAPVVAAVLLLRDSARGDETVGKDGLTATKRGMKTLKWLAFIELIFETIPQSILQTYVGVSYGQFTFADPNFSWLLVVSVFLGVVTGGLGAVGAQALLGGEAVSLSTAHGVCLLLGRAGQLGSTVFAFSLLGCAYKNNGVILGTFLGTMFFLGTLWLFEPNIRNQQLERPALGAARNLGMFLYLACLWMFEPDRNPERGPLKPLLLNLLQPLAVCGMLYWFYAGDHVDNNYADRSQEDIWRYTYTNSTTAETEAIGVSEEEMDEYAALRIENTDDDTLDPAQIRYRHKDFALWPELTTGGTISEDFTHKLGSWAEEYRGLVLEPLPANGTGTWSTPFSYECRDRTCGLYPTYTFLAMSVLGMTAAMLLDPRCGIGEAAKASQAKVRNDEPP